MNMKFIVFRHMSQPKHKIFISVQDVSGETGVAQQLCWMSRAIRWVAKWTPPGKNHILTCGPRRVQENILTYGTPR